MRVSNDIIDIYRKNKENFVWIVYLKTPNPLHEIKPSFIDWTKIGVDNPNFTEILINELPKLNLLEGFVDEELDYITKNFAITKRYIWDTHNGEYRSFMMFFKDGEFVKHSIGECFCSDTLMRNIGEIMPDSLEPSGIS